MCVYDSHIDCGHITLFFSQVRITELISDWKMADFHWLPLSCLYAKAEHSVQDNRLDFWSKTCLLIKIILSVEHVNCSWSKSFCVWRAQRTNKCKHQILWNNLFHGKSVSIYTAFGKHTHIYVNEKSWTKIETAIIVLWNLTATHFEFLLSLLISCHIYNRNCFVWYVESLTVLKLVHAL